MPPDAEGSSCSTGVLWWCLNISSHWQLNRWQHRSKEGVSETHSKKQNTNDIFLNYYFQTVFILLIHHCLYFLSIITYWYMQFNNTVHSYTYCIIVIQYCNCFMNIILAAFFWFYFRIFYLVQFFLLYSFHNKWKTKWDKIPSLFILFCPMVPPYLFLLLDHN